MDTSELSDEVISRFWSKVDQTGPNGCWLWTGWINSSGHPRFDVGGRKVLATHVSLALAGEPRPAPPGDYALHGDLCSPRCCNPAPNHVRWGTAKANAEDRERLGRHDPAKGEVNGNSKLTAETVRLIRASPHSQKVTGKMYGCSGVWVGKIQRREVWAHVP